jgi:hypothetical protein
MSWRHCETSENLNVKNLAESKEAAVTEKKMEHLHRRKKLKNYSNKLISAPGNNIEMKQAKVIEKLQRGL